jgi:hypothetical protein
MRERVRALREDGLGTNEIARRLDVNRSTVVFHTRRLGLPVDERGARRHDWNAVRAAYESGLSACECRERFGCSRSSWADAVTRGDIVPRERAVPLEAILVKGVRAGRRHLKARLLASGLKDDVCERCGVRSWEGRPLSMQVHHRNGEPTDNRIENLELLCPNCHSQTENWGSRNRSRLSPSGGRAGADAA